MSRDGFLGGVGVMIFVAVLVAEVEGPLRASPTGLVRVKWRGTFVEGLKGGRILMLGGRLMLLEKRIINGKGSKIFFEFRVLLLNQLPKKVERLGASGCWGQ